MEPFEPPLDPPLCYTMGHNMNAAVYVDQTFQGV